MGLAAAVTYRFFHRTLASNVPLASLPPGDGALDLSLRLVEEAPLRDHASRGPLHLEHDSGVATMTLRRSARALHVFWEVRGEGAMLARLEPRRWTVRAIPRYVTEHAERGLFTVSKKLLMGEAGEVFLHASCAARAGRAYAFAGPTEVGKTTLAGALAAFRGFDLYADDAFPWTVSGGQVEVAQGPLLIQLADGNPLVGRHGWPALERLDFMTKAVFVTPAAPPYRAKLAGVWLLSTGPLEERVLSRGEAMAALLPFLGAGARPVDRAGVQHLRDLVDRVPVARLSVPREGDLAETAARVQRVLERVES